MATVLVVFESKYGQTAKIAEVIGATARREGHEVRVRHIANLVGTEIADYDAVAVVAPVYFSHHTRPILGFVREHAAELAKVQRSAFFSVSNSAASRDPLGRKEAEKLAATLPADLGWNPHLVATAGGAVAYPRYGFFTRFVMKRIARSKGEPVDTEHVHELTDWAKLDRDIHAMLAPFEVKQDLAASA